MRDDQVWSQLIELKNYTSESFAVWRFHFRKGADNSGFVDWLATRLKVLFGTGVSCNNVKITMLYINTNGVLIGTDGTETNLTNCATTYITLDNTHSNADAIYTMLLTAYIDGSLVQVRSHNTTGNTGACTVNYARTRN